ncbi:hypothetical protein, partial [Enterococcus faecium]|uniref:hypothetical protein n=1 Tax=Enterococcus faecium TaxID=1352 RepID=UPI001CBBD924
LHRFDQRSNGFGLTAGRNDEILTRWNLEKILTNRVRGIDSNPRRLPQAIHVMQVSPSQKQVRITGRTLT